MANILTDNFTANKMLNVNRAPKEKFSASTKRVLLLAFTALAISAQAGTLKSQDSQDSLERVSNSGIAARSSNSVSGFAGATLGRAPLFPSLPSAAGGPVGLAPVMKSPRSGFRPERARRSPFLVGLYATQIAMQVLDAHSTLQALQSGMGREGNSVVKPFASSPAALFGIKIGTASGMIQTLDRLHKTPPRAATVALIVINCGYGFVVAHNYSVLSATHPNR